jgi:hypothetical protein
MVDEVTHVRPGWRAATADCTVEGLLTAAGGRAGRDGLRRIVTAGRCSQPGGKDSMTVSLTSSYCPLSDLAQQASM